MPPPPCHVAHEEFSRTCAHAQYIQQVLWEIFSFQVQLLFSIFRLGLFYNEVLLDTVMSKYTARRIRGIYRAEKRRAICKLQWRHISVFREISKDTISKIKYTALFQNLMKPSLKSSSTIFDYVKVQQLDDK